MGLATTHFFKIEKNFSPFTSYSLSNFSTSQARYGLGLNKTLFMFFTRYPHFATLIASAPTPSPLASVATKGSDDILYAFTGRNFSTPLKLDGLLSIYKTIQLEVHVQALKLILEIYKMFILVALSHKNGYFVFKKN